MVNIDDNINEKSINFDKNDMEFDGIESEYVYPDSPELNFADDEGEDIIQYSTNEISATIFEEENVRIDSDSDSTKITENCNKNVESEGNKEDTEGSSRHKKRRHSRRNDESEEIVKSKKFRRNSSTLSSSDDESANVADINNKESDEMEECISSNVDDFPDEDASCFRSTFEAYNKLFSSKNYPRICPYLNLKEIDKNIPIKQKSGLSLLFPINAFFDKKLNKTEPLLWNSDKIQQFQSHESESDFPIEDKLLLSDLTEVTDNIISKFNECIESPKPLPISDNLMPKTEYEKNYWKNLMPRIGFSFIIQPGMARIEKEKWLRLKEIDTLNGYEWTEMDTGYDLLNK